MEGDPPLIDCPALAFSPTNVIARQSLRSGGRSPLLARSPVARRSPQHETPRAWPPSVARLRSCRAGCRCLCPVSQVSTATSHRLPRRFAMWTPNHSSDRSRCASCTRLALRFPSITIAGFRGCSAPFLGHRLACAVRYAAHSERAITAGQEVFFVRTGLSATKASYAQNNFGRPLVAHRLYTARH